jgi:glutathione-independent formaldehyde dehydrogenase
MSHSNYVFGICKSILREGTLITRELKGNGMRALVYNGLHNVSVNKVPEAKIERPTDVVVKITATDICGSDLRMYEGRTDIEPGRVLGHENLGEVVEVGNAVDKIKLGDQVCIPFDISCGHCRNCETGLTAFCLHTNPNPAMAGAAYGFADMGPYNGGQAE